jgi:hypothetical protein
MILPFIGQSQLNIEVQPDGKRYTRVLLSGATSSKYDIVFIGDGFTKNEQGLFNQKVDQALTDLQTSVPYAQSMCSFNIWRVNLISQESGISNPNRGIVKRTELGCRFGDTRRGEPDRCIYTADKSKCFQAAGTAPEFNAVIVLVNDAQWGGCENDLIFCTINPDFSQIITHEMGHKIGNLADEYNCYLCDRSEPDREYIGPEPTEVNLTKENTIQRIKWANLILPGTALPTTLDNPFGVIGLFEGGKYYTKKIFRPQMNCHMRDTQYEFCVVCRNELLRKLRLYCGP